MQRQNNWRRHSGRSSGGRAGSNRGRGRQNSTIGKNPLRQQLDSNGPLGRVRGNALQIMEKYLVLAKEATSDGDRVLAEACLQYAEHYQRMISEHQGSFKPSDDDAQTDNYGDIDPAEMLAPRPRAARPQNGEGVRIMGRGVVRYLDDSAEADGDDGGEAGDKDGGGNLPSFLTGSQRAEGKRKSSDNDDNL